MRLVQTQIDWRAAEAEGTGALSWALRRKAREARRTRMRRGPQGAAW
jgi:hypothetical protein